MKSKRALLVAGVLLIGLAVACSSAQAQIRIGIGLGIPVCRPYPYPAITAIRTITATRAPIHVTIIRIRTGCMSLRRLFMRPPARLTRHRRPLTGSSRSRAAAERATRPSRSLRPHGRSPRRNLSSRPPSMASSARLRAIYPTRDLLKSCRSADFRPIASCGRARLCFAVGGRLLSPIFGELATNRLSGLASYNLLWKAQSHLSRKIAGREATIPVEPPEA